MSNVRQAVILVGGLGTRLGEMTRTVPKPMLPIAGRPFLEYLLSLLHREGFNRVLFCTSHLADVIENYFQDGSRFGFQISYSREPEPLGTGGAVRLAMEKLDEQYLVLNGDTIFDIPMRQLADLLGRYPQASAAMALRQVDDVARYGSVRAEGDLVTAFEEKGRTGRGWINGGIYCLRKSALDFLPPGVSSLERDLFPRLAVAGQLCALTKDGYFLDIGLPETLEQAREQLPSRFVF
jgi:NDP-sugar pyrophosphorylase family protein